MILTEDLIIVTPPKTGSCSLETCLCDMHDIGTRIMMKLRQPGDLTIHGWTYPDWLRDHREVVMTVRNPYDRLVSLWKYSEFREYTLERFFTEIVSNPDCGWFNHYQLNKFQPHGLSETIRFEGLSAWVQKRFQVNLPWCNRSERVRSWEYYYTPHLYGLVSDWAHEDCRRYGYSTVTL